MTRYPLDAGQYRLVPVPPEVDPALSCLVPGLDLRSDLSLYRPDLDFTRCRSSFGTLAAGITAGTMELFLAVEGAGSDPIGVTGLYDIDLVRGTGALLGAFSPEDRKAKRCSDPVKAVLGYGFQTLGLRRITALVAEDDGATATQYTAFGFVREGLLRKVLPPGDSEGNVLVFGCLRKEYRVPC